MTNRLFGIATITLMLVANAALIARDILPSWLASDPPEPAALQLADREEVNVQFGIFNHEQRIGYAWVSHERSGELVTARYVTALLPLNLPGKVETPAFHVETTMRYRGAKHLEELRVGVFGLGLPVTFTGEFYPPDEFACEWQVDERRGELVLPADATRAMGDVLRPFDGLTGLEVGQTWRVNMINPLAGVIPGWADRMMSSQGVLARVVAKATIEHRGETIETFVVATDRARAWVTPDGRVIRQELELPLLGDIRLEEEPFNVGIRYMVIHSQSSR